MSKQNWITFALEESESQRPNWLPNMKSWLKGKTRGKSRLITKLSAKVQFFDPNLGHYRRDPSTIHHYVKFQNSQDAMIFKLTFADQIKKEEFLP